ncbi:hypothetical protein CTI12_AA394970 [Artemisia annua]|uniref:Uncharacterized protein n=1 Tax=Artemisia annua TaxID=35608 RepID=A0A2U1MDB7_ARTAN|nr:hypothetical protein CTI12_AA394970 [Artemisia annua]
MQQPLYKSKKKVSFGEVKVHGDKDGTQEHLKENHGFSSFIEEKQLEYGTKPKWQVFMFGFGTGKFPTKMKLSDIKSRQYRQQATSNMSDSDENESGRRRSGKKRWWRMIDVFRCGGGYKGDAEMKELQASFPTIRKFD